MSDDQKVGVIGRRGFLSVLAAAATIAQAADPSTVKATAGGVTERVEPPVVFEPAVAEKLAEDFREQMLPRIGADEQKMMQALVRQQHDPTLDWYPDLAYDINTDQFTPTMSPRYPNETLMRAYAQELSREVARRLKDRGIVLIGYPHGQYESPRRGYTTRDGFTWTHEICGVLKLSRPESVREVMKAGLDDLARQMAEQLLRDHAAAATHLNEPYGLTSAVVAIEGAGAMRCDCFVPLRLMCAREALTDHVVVRADMLTSTVI